MWRACLHAPPLRWLIGLSAFPTVSGRALKLPDYGGACGANTYAHIGKGRAFPRAAVWVLLALLSVTWGFEAFGQLSTDGFWLVVGRRSPTLRMGKRLTSLTTMRRGAASAKIQT